MQHAASPVLHTVAEEAWQPSVQHHRRPFQETQPKLHGELQQGLLQAKELGSSSSSSIYRVSRLSASKQQQVPCSCSPFQ
jgi:hypothetical protein